MPLKSHPDSATLRRMMSRSGNDLIRFNVPSAVGRELEYTQDAIARGDLGGGGYYAQRCEEFLERMLGAPRVFLTTSCTSALEIAALLCDLELGDEVILPSFTFVSTANAFVLRGAHPKFVDMRPDTLNIDEDQIADAVSERTKVIVPVHYGGVAAQMDRILELAGKRGLIVVEDAAQALNATYKDRYLGTLGQLGTFSFHDTKNITSGEGGALVINEPAFIERAEILKDKGTNLRAFMKGQVDKYTWVDVGSSYAPSGILAAFLLGQLERINKITRARQEISDFYRLNLGPLRERGYVQLPHVPQDCGSSYHLFYLLLESSEMQHRMLEHLRQDKIQAVFHYVPLHSSPMGKKFGYREGMLPVTESISARLVRLPMHMSLTRGDLRRITRSI